MIEVIEDSGRSVLAVHVEDLHSTLCKELVRHQSLFGDTASYVQRTIDLHNKTNARGDWARGHEFSGA